MRKSIYAVLVFLFVAAFSVADAYAGVRCWVIQGSSDIIKVGLIKSGGGGKVATGYQYVPNTYQLPGSGVFRRDLDPSKKRLSLSLTNNDLSIAGGNVGCVLDATLDKTSVPPLQGPVTIDCGAGAFNVTGALVPIDCATAPPISVSAPDVEAMSDLPGMLE